MSLTKFTKFSIIIVTWVLYYGKNNRWKIGIHPVLVTVPYMADVGVAWVWLVILLCMLYTTRAS